MISFIKYSSNEKTVEMEAGLGVAGVKDWMGMGWKLTVAIKEQIRHDGNDLNIPSANILLVISYTVFNFFNMLHIVT